MTPDELKNTPDQEPGRADISAKKVPVSVKNNPHIISYMVILFLAAFLLLIVSYFMQQRRTDLEVISGLQDSGLSASQTIHNVLERNQQLLDDNRALREQLDARQEAAQEQEETLLAMDWLWRIQREYYRGYYSSARTLIRSFEATGLVDKLPTQPLVDEEYRTPTEQYQSIYNALF
ncbi:MAG: hypothetical protein J6Q14_04680 [Oscillospiraceae bacterium]|nr:hypothetical protein [Oscillospiraceae bacterium]